MKKKLLRKNLEDKIWDDKFNVLIIGCVGIINGSIVYVNIYVVKEIWIIIFFVKYKGNLK